MKFLPKFGLCVVFLTLSLAMNAQKTAVVLINEQPTRVVLEDGNIAEIMNTVPGYMDGFERAPNDLFQKIRLQDIQQLRSIDTDDPLLASESTIDEADGTYINMPENIDEESLSRSINFSFESAILSDESLQTIEDYAEILKNKTARSILLKSWYKSGDSRSEQLVRNRLDACRQYLEAQGVASNIILTSLVGSNRESRFVSVVLN